MRRVVLEGHEVVKVWLVEPFREGFFEHHSDVGEVHVVPYSVGEGAGVVN
jgi:hypothetical protein